MRVEKFVGTTTRVETGLPSELPFTREDIEQTIPERFEQAVRRFANHIALTGNGQRWTYSDLNRRANRIADAIKAFTKSGAGCVAFLADQSPEMVIATLGVLKAGKTYLAIHPLMPTLAQQEIVRDAAPELVLTTPALESRAREIAGGTAEVLALNTIDERYSEEDPAVSICPSDLSTIIYTSGSTGKPKGVMKSHRAVLHRVWLSAQHDAIVPSDRQSLLTHCSFSASEADIFGALLQGATVCVFDIASEGLASFRAWLDEEGITLLHPPVLLFRRFLSTLEGTNLFPSVRLVALAGDVVLPADLEKWKRHFSSPCVLMHRFSLTETALLTVARIDRDAVVDPTHALPGRSVADKLVTLIDEAGGTVAEGRTGEVVVQSRYIADGYWRQPEATGKAFKVAPAVPKERIYRTGDLGRFLPDGTLALLGRRDHLLKIRSYRVDTREVESAMMQLPEITEVATVERKQDDESRLWAFVVLKQGTKFDPLAVRERLRQYLPDWKIPARFQAVPAMPMTLAGKVDKQLLAELASREAGGLPQPAPEAPRGEASHDIEKELTDIWKDTLRLDDVGQDDNFLDLGGDSISAMMTLNRIERRYGIQLKFADFFRHGTIRELAAVVTTRTARTEVATASKAIVEGDSEPGPGRGQVDNVADAYLELLNAYGVDYLFINPGTDLAPILESIAKFKAQGRPTPEAVLCLHESVAMAAAHGYFMVSGRVQVVMVHVDVGTQNLGANLHNAQRGARSGHLRGEVSVHNRWIRSGRSEPLQPLDPGTVQSSQHRAGLCQVAVRADVPGKPSSGRAAGVPVSGSRALRPGLFDASERSADAADGSAGP